MEVCPTTAAEACQRARKWVHARWTGAHCASYTNTADPTLLATCFAILTEETLGDLSDKRRLELQQCAEWICEKQNPQSGLFAPGDVVVGDLRAKHVCDADYIRWQITYFALSALYALDVTPRWPLTFARPFLDPAYAQGWMDGGPWQDPWNHSNRIMFMLRFLLHIGMSEDEPHALKVYECVLNRLHATQDPATGLWHGPNQIDMRMALFAAYHFFPFLLWQGLVPKRWHAIVDSALSVQTKEGLFGSRRGGGACEDLDVIDILAKSLYIEDYRSADIRAALIRSLTRLLTLQNPDGGFPNYLHVPTRASYRRRLGTTLRLHRLFDFPVRPALTHCFYSGWCRVGAENGESDMWGTWFRVLAITEIVDALWGRDAIASQTAYHGLPCLGWHDASRLVALRERVRLKSERGGDLKTAGS